MPLFEQVFGRYLTRPFTRLWIPALLLNLAILFPAASFAANYGIQLEGFAYPYEIHRFEFQSQGQALTMAYMDVLPTSKPSGKVAVLLHGKNFCGATWESTIAALAADGYRVIAPDQIGFCASTKPEKYQYSFQQLANNTMALLNRLGIRHATFVSHSTGGMLAIRLSLMYPQSVDHLVLVNPIGLEDWKALGVPSRTVDEWYARELATSAAKIREYERRVYYVGRWQPAYEKWVDMLAGLNAGPGHELVAWNSALIYDMIFTQPVVYEFSNISVRTTLMIGDKDTTAIGSDVAPPDVLSRIGRYDRLGPEAARRIPRAKLVIFPGLGHAPQIEDPDYFNCILIKLDKDTESARNADSCEGKKL